MRLDLCRSLGNTHGLRLDQRLGLSLRLRLLLGLYLRLRLLRLLLLLLLLLRLLRMLTMVLRVMREKAAKEEMEKQSWPNSLLETWSSRCSI